VVPSELRIGAAYRIQGNIKRLEQEIGGKQSTGVLELELSVIDESDDHLVVSKVYHSEQTAKDNSIDGAVAALDAALTDILKQFVADIDAQGSAAMDGRNAGHNSAAMTWQTART
jgi:ABC-type uncharacterized transport system auxiliary subunit